MSDTSKLFDEVDGDFRKKDEHMQGFKKDFEAIESFKKNLMTSMSNINNNNNKVPMITDDEASIKSNIPIITDEDSTTKFRFNQNH